MSIQPLQRTGTAITPSRGKMSLPKELFDSIHERDRLPAYPHVLAPWVESHAAERDWLRSFASGSGGEVPPAQVEDLWRLYALGRVNEVLLLRFQRVWQNFRERLR